MKKRLMSKHTAVFTSCVIFSHRAFVTGLLLLTLAFLMFPARAFAQGASLFSFLSSDTYSETVSVPRMSMNFELRGENPYDYPVFTFQFAAEKSGYPMPNGTDESNVTQTLEGAGSIDFGSISFSKAGVYVYEISQLPCDSPAWRYDETYYQFKVVAVERDSGLSITTSLTNLTTQEACDTALFTNIYCPSQAQENEQFIETHTTSEQLKPDTPEELSSEQVGPVAPADISGTNSEDKASSSENDKNSQSQDNALTNGSAASEIPKIGPMQSPISPISNAGVSTDFGKEVENPVFTATIVCVVVIIVSVLGIALMQRRRVKTNIKEKEEDERRSK